MLCSAMGKLGSREMSYLSDFTWFSSTRRLRVEHDHVIPSEIVRLIQRFMNMLQVPLADGPGYPMDVRLRPTGTHGTARGDVGDSWLEYYGTADIWEIQALLRLRHVAGDDGLGRWIEGRAARICSAPRFAESVWPRICHLRGRMERERAAESAGEIDLKLGIGGLADIEFIVQGQLLTSGRVGRSVRQMAEKKLSAAFRALRALDHRVRLHTNSTSAKLDEPRFDAMISLGLWPPRTDGDLIETWEDILRLRREVRAAFREFCP